MMNKNIKKNNKYLLSSLFGNKITVFILTIFQNLYDYINYDNKY